MGRRISNGTSTVLLAQKVFVVAAMLGVIVVANDVACRLVGQVRRNFGKIFGVLQKLIDEYELFQIAPRPSVAILSRMRNCAVAASRTGNPGFILLASPLFFVCSIAAFRQAQVHAESVSAIQGELVVERASDDYLGIEGCHSGYYGRIAHTVSRSSLLFHKHPEPRLLLKLARNKVALFKEDGFCLDNGAPGFARSPFCQLSISSSCSWLHPDPAVADRAFLQ